MLPPPSLDVSAILLLSAWFLSLALPAAYGFTRPASRRALVGTTGDLGYLALRWPIPRAAPRGRWLALSDLCSVSTLLLGLALAGLPLASLGLEESAQIAATGLWCAGLPALAGACCNALVLRVGLARAW
jgi:hypothetical protein